MTHEFSRPGTSTFTARATDRVGAWKQSEPVTVHAQLPAAAAELLWTDTTTQGAWIGAYGTEGFAIPVHWTNYPAYAAVDFGAASERLYLPEGGMRELQKPDGSGRVFSVWTVVMPIQLKFLDGSNHVVAAYFVDPEGTRHQRIQLLDADTGTPLLTHDLPSFRDGVYLVLKMRGHVKMQIPANYGPSTYLGALLFEASPDSDSDGKRLSTRGFSDGWMTFGLGRSKLIPNVSWMVEASEDLIRWQPAAGVVSEPADLGFAEELRFHVPAGAGPSHRQFYRLRQWSEP